MEEKEYLGHQRSIDKELLAPVDDGASTKEMLKSFDKAFVEDYNKECNVKESVLGIVQALQQSTDNSHSKTEHQGNDMTTVRRLFGKFVPDYLSGESKKRDNELKNDIHRLTNSIIALIDRSDFSDIKDSQEFKQLISLLSEKAKIKKDDPTLKIDNVVTHNKDEYTPHSCQSYLHNSSYSPKSDTIRTVGGEMSRAEWERRRKAEKEERDRQNALHEATREAVRYSELEAIRAAREEKERNAMMERFRRKHPK